MAYKDLEKKRKTLMDWRRRTGRVKAWRPCRVKKCAGMIRSDNKHGYCRDHKDLAPRIRKPRKNRKKVDRSEYRARYYLDHKEESKQSCADWKAANPEAARAISRRSSKKFRDKKALEAAAAAKLNPRPPTETEARLLEIATARAAGARYGYTGIPSVSRI